MLTANERSARPVAQLVVTWLMMIPLFFFACRGILWFQAGSNGLGAVGFNSMAGNKGAGTAIVLLTVFAFVIALISTRLLSVLDMCWQHKVLMVLAIYPAMSALWSQDRQVTLQFGIFLLFDVLFAFYLHVRFSGPRLIRLFMLIGWIVVVGSILFSVLLPTYGIDHRASTSGDWQGVFVYKNTCAIMATFLMSAAIFLPVRTGGERFWRATYVLLNLFLVAMTQARTGWVIMACLLGYAVITQLIGRFRADNRVAVASIVAVTTLFLMAICGIYYREILLSMGKDPTLTGRTDIWKLAIHSAMKRPLLGYGYRAFWSGLKGESANITLMEQWTVPGAHNGFIETWLDIGLVGVGLVIVTLVRAVRDAIRCVKQGATPAVKWYISILIMTVVTNLAEMTLVFPNYLTWIMYVLACVGLAHEEKQTRLARA